MHTEKHLLTTRYYSALWHQGVVSTLVPMVSDLGRPRGVAVDGEGNIYFADTDRHRVGCIFDYDHSSTANAPQRSPTTPHHMSI